MLRSKKVIILALLVTGAAIGLNWNFYLELIRGGPPIPAGDPGSDAKEGPTGPGPTPPERGATTPPSTEPLGASLGSGIRRNPAELPAGGKKEDPAPAPGSTDNRGPVATAPAQGGPAPSPGADPPAGTDDDGSRTQPSPPSPLMKTIEKLVATLASVRNKPARPEPRSMTAFHSDAEAVSGMTLERLLDEAEKAREAREKAKIAPETVLLKQASTKPDGAAPADATSPAAPKAVTAESMIESSELTCIMKAGSSSLCVISRKRLRVGDRFPGTQFKLSEISDRVVTFSDGTVTIVKELASLTTGKSSQGSTPPTPAPGEEGGS